MLYVTHVHACIPVSKVYGAMVHLVPMRSQCPGRMDAHAADVLYRCACWMSPVGCLHYFFYYIIHYMQRVPGSTKHPGVMYAVREWEFLSPTLLVTASPRVTRSDLAGSWSVSISYNGHHHDMVRMYAPFCLLRLDAVGATGGKPAYTFPN
jgi:hypothetical protein